MAVSETDSREKILLAAKSEFAEKGYNGSRMDAIAKKAGVNKALIHYYFSNKEDLYRNVRMKILGIGNRNEVMIYLPKTVLTPQQKLYFILYYLVKVFQRIKDRDVFRIFFWEVVEGNRLHEEAVREYRIPQARIITGIIREGIEKGVFETSDPRLFTMVILSFLNMYVLEGELHSDGGIIRELYGDADDGTVLDFIIETAFRSLGVRAKPVKPSVPEELLVFADQLIENIAQNIGDGYAQAALAKIEEFLLG